MVLQYRFRLYLIAFLVIGAFSGLLFRLWDVQITNQSLYAGQLSSTRTITVREPGVRGKIKDRSGHTLVSNRLEYQLVLNLRVIAEDYDPAEHAHRDKNGNPMTPRVTQTRVRNGLSDSREVKDIATIVEETVIAPLAEMELAIDYTDSLRRQIANHYDMTDPAGLVPYTLPLALSYRRFAMLSERSLEIVGLQAKAAPVRNYDYGSLACHVLGYVRTADRAKDLEDLKQRAAGEGKEAVEAKRWLDYDHVYEPDPFGVLAIEKSSDQELKGRAGFREHLIDQKGIYVRDTKHESAQQGLDVRLTLDLRAQYIVESALRKANGGRGVGRGAAVLIDPNTGGILAMASVPTVDPNKFIPAISQDDFDVYNANKAKPFLNRSVGAYATGSVFKVAIALAGSLAEVENYRTVCTGGVTYGNRRIKCMGHHGTIGLQRAIMKSCNSFFYRYGNQSGIDNIISVTDMMGLGQKFNLPIEENGQTLIPSKSWLEETKPGAKWTDALTAQVSIGQGGVATSPLQMAQVAAVVASRGKCYKLRLVERTEEADGTPVNENPPELLYDLTEHGVRSEVIERVRNGMYDVVNTTGGTARRARLDNVKVAGKTSTAQKYTGKGTHAWFIAFAPYDDPKYALAVFVEDGESGGKVAAPIAKRILQELFRTPQSIRFPRLEDDPGNFDTHSEITYEGDLWTVPEGEMDTADTAVAVNDPTFLGPSSAANSEYQPQSLEVRERASLVPPKDSRRR